jgi:hypothetical protein
LAGRGIETARLYADELRNKENFRIVDLFLTDMVGRLGIPTSEGKAAVWRAVPAEHVGKLLREFLVHPLNHDFQGDAIADFLDDAVAQGDPRLATWTVAVPLNGEMGPVEPGLSCGLNVNAKRRKILVRSAPPQSLLVSGKGARVGSRSDVHNGLSAEKAQEVIRESRQENPDQKEVPEDAFRAAMESPLLVVYLLRGVKEEGGSETDYKNRLVLPALGLHFPGTKDPTAPKRYVNYRLNTVAQNELELDGDDLGSDVDED